MAESTTSTLIQPPYRELLTERLYLRTFRPSDAKAILPILSDRNVMQWTSQGVQTDLEQAERWASTRSLGPSVFNFVVYERSKYNTHPDEAPIIGVIGSFNAPFVGYVFNADYFGKGYATEAMQGLIQQIFDHFAPRSQNDIAYDHIEGWTDALNTASRRVLLKSGFTLCETRMQDFTSISFNEVRDTAVFRLARPGKSLADLGLLPGSTPKEDERPIPPIE
ncbi:hypothetical protein LTR78_009454 [Recurvomyces mirabilis]|uniref:N-acetyltransferase domain-containing protein n=1 Tax=Recurvomyces mirabilis TaxID=574656 RepID=A0AAE0TNP0_9PEZI|nr:hypothetical protein LTR78_009454 [Recurvomyces mirabilis]KAK5152359.1 hypothetical protein LTS14_008306 [Recurvomyces mirabilis]